MQTRALRVANHKPSPSVEQSHPELHSLLKDFAEITRLAMSNYGVATIFSGLSSTDRRNPAGWAAEIHTDGRLIAGPWNIPKVPVNGTPAACLSDLHMDAFRDFAERAESVAAVIGCAGPSCMTAILLATNSLQPVRRGNHWAHQPRPATWHTLQWRVRTGVTDQLRAIGDAMAADYKRAFAF